MYISLDRPSNHDVLSVLYVVQHLGLTWHVLQPKLQSKLISLVIRLCSKDQNVFVSCMMLLRASDVFSSMSSRTLASINAEIGYLKEKTLENAASIAASVSSYLDEHSVFILFKELLRVDNIDKISIEHVNTLLELVLTATWCETWKNTDEVDRNFYQKSFVGVITRVCVLLF